MRQLHHNGVLVPPPYKAQRLRIRVKGKIIELTPEQEEMAVAWARKIGTPYERDAVFAKNFHKDFSKKLGMKVKPGDVDYSEILKFIEKEREAKACLSKEARKRLAEIRKAEREANKRRYGCAWVDGVKMEVANYCVEPSSIFMGRGKHPLRGRWKEGPRHEDIELNLSPDAPMPPGKWKGRVWFPNVMWIARWRDKLTGRMKYVWLSDSTKLKQEKDIEKFEKAKELLQNLDKIKRHIWSNLDSNDPRRKKIATVCFLIDYLKIRVGDEKDPEEADTVGASTLRPEHIKFCSDGTVIFNFLGKDSVPHIFRVHLPDKVKRNLKEFASNTGSTLFEGVNSKRVSEFLDEVMVGLSAKVFRTCYASQAVKKIFEGSEVKASDPIYRKKFVARMANLEAAKVCNHKRTIPKKWRISLQKKMQRLRRLKEEYKRIHQERRKKILEFKERYSKAIQKRKDKLRQMQVKLRQYELKLEENKRMGKSIVALKKRIKQQKELIKKQREKIKKIMEIYIERLKKLREKLRKKKSRHKEAIEKLRLEITIMRETRDYNLTTSLKSYIDPRIYYTWGKKIDYDWKLYYPKSLQKKFSWVERMGIDGDI